MSGYLKDGQWHEGWYDTGKTAGEFVRTTSRFRSWITADGASGYRAEPGRYHLYVSLACPWAHRTLIARALKGLQDVISVSVVEPVMTQGWSFSEALPDHLHGFQYLYQLYLAADPQYTGRVLVPVLWDKKTRTIVSNESSEILRMFDAAFARNDVDLYPVALRAQIDEANAFVYDNINNGVYRCGFATTQEAYEAAYDQLFARLDVLEERLTDRRFLMGEEIREVDVRLFTTLVRFDAVYHGHFKCNRQKLTELPNLWRYARELYALPGFGDTVDFDHIKRHYYLTHDQINPTGIVPKGPDPAVWLGDHHGRG
jgi:glutathionyl-hydroquinone reductase